MNKINHISISKKILYTIFLILLIEVSLGMLTMKFEIRSCE